MNACDLSAVEDKTKLTTECYKYSLKNKLLRVIIWLGL